VKRLPHGREVDQALRAVQAAVKEALIGLNEAAAQVMAQGDYVVATTLAAKGQEIQQFRAKVDALRNRWQAVRGAGADDAKASGTPLWAYYQPILKALSEADGEAGRADLETKVERLLGDTGKPGDRERMARGQERWQVMIRRARKHLVTEGWIEADTGKVWRITDAGRRAAEKPLEP